MSGTTAADLGALREEVVSCRACPRLVEWRESVASEPRASFRGETYWGRPVPGFGDPRARLLIVGLAPAAHGGNRTGRIFTGDRSGDFLFAALHRTGFANQAESVALDDGLRLRGAYMAAAVRCAPPANKPTPRERDECRPYLVREIDLLRRVRVVLALGGFAYQAAWAALRDTAGSRAGPTDRVVLPARRPRFAHGLEVEAGRMTIVGCYHPSQQNTFTGRLTPEMLDTVLTRTRHLTR